MDKVKRIHRKNCPSRSDVFFISLGVVLIGAISIHSLKYFSRTYYVLCVLLGIQKWTQVCALAVGAYILM